ncbi:unnamed protein product [Acanthoscelides obtectus]|uniref:Uncharacterized protein n=1 Tax=Acanthoscelides obtectus TaxID=200917 RepID=A0A9P0MC79_ACAOB|nr:unnamed protein product [Acanthoscelides obtectus]CAK1660256.1 hypothetical protein AOBTE_LOCUS21945 [Acanthoscelides obtectus]
MSSQEGENSRRHWQGDDEKPLKKAKYMWQVKGKQHLKENDNSDDSIMDNGPSTTSNPEPSTSSSQDYISFGNNGNMPNLPETRVLVPYYQDNLDVHFRNLQTSWEVRQMARCLLDNTINSFVDDFRSEPMNADHNHPFEGFDFDSHDYVCEKCNNDGQVEDDAILMAIQAHGLRGNAGEENPGIAESTQDNIQNMQAELKQNNALHGRGQEDMIQDSSGFLDAAVSAAIQEKGLTYGY